MSSVRLRGEGLDWRAVGEEVIALDTAASVYVAANTAAAVLWRELAAGTTRARLVDTLVAEYGLPVETARQDVDAFLSDLGRRGFLEGPCP